MDTVLIGLNTSGISRGAVCHYKFLLCRVWSTRENEHYHSLVLKISLRVDPLQKLMAQLWSSCHFKSFALKCVMERNAHQHILNFKVYWDLLPVVKNKSKIINAEKSVWKKTWRDIEIKSSFIKKKNPPKCLFCRGLSMLFFMLYSMSNFQLKDISCSF